jgi:hypothetical protein
MADRHVPPTKVRGLNPSMAYYGAAYAGFEVWIPAFAGMTGLSR